MTVERMAIYSYFAIYLSDFIKEESCIHPKIPNRNASYINCKDAIMQALDLLLTKGLVECEVKSSSLKFRSTLLGDSFYDEIGGVYKEKLISSINKVHKLMKCKSDRYLNNYVYNNMVKWGSEFEYESLLKEIGYAE